MKTFLLAMVLHPVVQSKAQEEIAKVCHHTELPTVSEMESLPYLMAVMLELLRWHATIPLGMI
jgi:cytochrome P450